MNRLRTICTALLLGTMLLNACSDKKKEQVGVQAKKDVDYTCSMHPQISQDHPGNCPICGMTLIKRSADAGKGAGISLNTVLQPVNSSVISTISGIVPEQLSVATTILAQGYLDFDTRTFNNIASRFSGRIEKLYIKFAFQKIHKGQRIFDIYSPDMVTAQQDLVYLTKNSPQETRLLNAARQKLLLQGMTEGQINQVVRTGKAFYTLPVYSPYEGHVHDAPHSQMAGAEQAGSPLDRTSDLPLSVKEGMYVEKGQNLFNVVDPHMLWAIIKVELGSMAGLKLGQPVTITLPDMPGESITGKVNFIEPTIQRDDKTTTIRVYLDNMDHRLKVNSLVKAEIQTGQIKGLWVPKSAVTDLGRDHIVWIKNGSIFRAKKVTTGTINNNEVLVTSGLAPTDSVASNAQYLTDSESFIKTKGNE